MSEGLQEYGFPIQVSMCVTQDKVPAKAKVQQDSSLLKMQGETSNGGAKKRSKGLSRKNTPETKAKMMKLTVGSDALGENQDQSYHENYNKTESSQSDSENELPSKDELRMLFKSTKHSHIDLKSACETIRCYILKQNPKRIDAWASYDSKDETKAGTTYETSIVFVLIYDSIEDLETDDYDLKYDHVKRLRCQKSREEKLVSEYMESNDVCLSDEDSRRIDLCMDNHAVDLMKRHKFLSILSKSAVKSKENGSQIIKKPCMTLYVHTKSCIPIDEEPFETEYDGVPVDVREGTLTMYTNSHEEHQKELKIGCQIGCSNSQGTLGGFIEHQRYGLCGITAAHVIFTESDLRVLADGPGKQEMHEFGSQREVYLPAEDMHKIGKAVAAVHKEGAKYETGIDAAIFTIEERRLLSGQPDGMKTQEDWYESGQIFESSWMNTSKDIIKYGAKTSKTQAKFSRHLDKIDFKEVDGTMKEYNVTMFNQIAVNSTDFAACGDSGSLVFTRLFDGRLACVGLLVGGTPDGLVVITPITPILREFGITSLKNLMIDKNENKLCVLEKKVDEGFDSVDKKLNQLLRAGEKNNSK